MDRIVKLKEYLENSPGDSFLLHALGLEFVKLGDDTTAQLYFEQLLEADPDYIGSYYHLGKLLERIGETERALEIFESGIKKAGAAGDNHARNELQAAWDELSDY